MDGWITPGDDAKTLVVVYLNGIIKTGQNQSSCKTAELIAN